MAAQLSIVCQDYVRSWWGVHGIFSETNGFLALPYYCCINSQQKMIQRWLFRSNTYLWVTAPKMTLWWMKINLVCRWIGRGEKDTRFIQIAHTLLHIGPLSKYYVLSLLSNHLKKFVCFISLCIYLQNGILQSVRSLPYSDAEHQKCTERIWFAPHCSWMVRTLQTRKFTERIRFAPHCCWMVRTLRIRKFTERIRFAPLL